MSEELAPVKPRTIAPFLITLLVFLLPVMLLPIATAPFQLTKVLCVVVLIALTLIVSAVGVVRTGSVTFSWSWLSLTLIALPFTYLVASIFSPSPAKSFFGYQLDTDTFGFMLLGVVLALVTAGVLANKARILSAFMALLAASWVVLLFQIVQVFFNAPFTLPGLNDPSVNLVGSWRDFGLFMGLIVALLLLALRSIPLSTLHRSLVGVTLAIALLFLALAGVPEAWILVALVSFAVVTYSFARRPLFRAEGGSPSLGTTVVSIALLLISLFFVFFGAGVTTGLQDSLKISAIAVRPSVLGTLNVIEQVWTKSPLVGSGPNTFANDWLLYRPGDVLLTPFWGVEFTSGSGAIPTAIATGGAVVLLAWLAFFLMLFYSVGKAAFALPASADRSYFLVSAAGLGAIYLAVLHIVDAPGQTLTLLLFLFVGIFLASVRGTSLIKTRTLAFDSSPRVGFVAVMASVLIALVALACVVGVGTTYASALAFNRATASFNAGDFDKAGKSIANAIALSGQDRYYRTAGLVDLAQLNNILQNTNPDAATQEKFRATLADAIQKTGTALAKDSSNYDNWFARGLVYAAVVPLKITGAYDSATAAFAEAAKRSTHAPEVDLQMAQIELAQGNEKAGRDRIAAALSQKADYTNAILLLAQVELAAGNLSKAIESVKSAVYFEPTNPNLLYQLGILLLAQKSYTDAATAFSAALAAQPNFQNASFFLAQADAYLGKTDEAAKLMEDLAAKNPDNDLVKEYRNALEAGKNPFKTAPTPPADTVPAKTE